MIEYYTNYDLYKKLISISRGDKTYISTAEFVVTYNDNIPYSYLKQGHVPRIKGANVKVLKRGLEALTTATLQ